MLIEAFQHKPCNVTDTTLPVTDWIEVDVATSVDFALYLVREYRLAYGPGWVIRAREVRS